MVEVGDSLALRFPPERIPVSSFIVYEAET